MCGADFVHLILAHALYVMRQPLYANDLVGFICDGVQIVIGHLAAPLENQRFVTRQ